MARVCLKYRIKKIFCYLILETEVPARKKFLGIRFYPAKAPCLCFARTEERACVMILSFVAVAVDRSESLSRNFFLQVLLLEPFNTTNLPCRKLTEKTKKGLTIYICWQVFRFFFKLFRHELKKIVEQEPKKHLGDPPKHFRWYVTIQDFCWCYSWQVST